MFLEIHSANLSFLIGVFRLLTFNVIIEMLGRKPDILLFIFSLFPIFHSSLSFFLPLSCELLEYFFRIPI